MGVRRLSHIRLLASAISLWLIAASVCAPVGATGASAGASKTSASPAANRAQGIEKHDPEKKDEEKGSTDKGADDSNPISMPEHATQITLWSLLVGLVSGLVLYRLIRFYFERFPKDQPRIEWLWILIGVGGALGHALFVGTKIGDHWEPAFDTTTVVWVGFAVIGLIYPRLSEVTLGTFGFKVQDAVKDVTDVVDKALSLTDKWATRLNYELVEVPHLSEDEVESRVASFLQDAAKDAVTWMGDDGETRRLAYWIYDKRADELGFFLSPNITPDTDPAIVRYRFSRGKGLLRRVLEWDSVRLGGPAPGYLNVSSARKENGFFPIPGDHSRYKGLLIVPIRVGDEALGVVSVDRALQLSFPKSSVKLIEALAAMAGTLMGQPAIRQKLEGQP